MDNGQFAKQDDFYPRSPRGERPLFVGAADQDQPISIHAPREGSDGDPLLNRDGVDISIHAPREGSDPPPSVDVDNQ